MCWEVAGIYVDAFIVSTAVTAALIILLYIYKIIK
jgi:hypothetical protein